MRRVMVLILLFLAPLIATGDERKVHTDRAGARILPLPEEEGVFHFLVFGDRTGGPPQGIEVLRQAVEDSNLLGPDLVMTVGDLVQGYNGKAEWLAQMKEFRGVMERLAMPWFPVAGNHDIYWRGEGKPRGEHEGDFEKHFGPLWYWFGHKNAAFVALYTDEGDARTGRKGFGRAQFNKISDRQIEWLEKTLGETKGYDHVFLFMHHPRWITRAYPESNWGRVHDLLVKAGNVSAVFAGHIHRMQYDGKRDGIEYFALATTGGSIPMDVPGTGWLHHMNLVTVRKGGITVATLPVGAVLDPKEMTPEHLREIDLVRSMMPKLLEGQIAVRPDGAAGGRTRYRLTNPSSRPVEVAAVIEGADARWRIAPDHRHLVIDPGATEEIAFQLVRAPDGFEEEFGAPLLSLAVDYLGCSRRISLPPRRIPLPLRLTGFESGAAPVEERAVQFDGRRSALAVASGDLDLPDGPITIEAWVRPQRAQKDAALVAKLEASEFGLMIEDGKPSFYVHLGGKYARVYANRTLKPGAWSHLAGEFDGSEIRIYVDGRLAYAKPAEGARRRNFFPLFVGADPNRRGKPGRFFEGAIDEVRVSRAARYRGKEFVPSRRLSTDADTVLLLHLDRALGPFVPDFSGRDAHARRVGEPVFGEVD